MVILSNSRKILVNLDNVVEIFIVADSIKANTVNGGRIVVEKYETSEDAEIAFRMLCDAVGAYERFVMPDQKQIHAYAVRTHDTAPQHVSGRKNKSHGGS